MRGNPPNMGESNCLLLNRAHPPSDLVNSDSDQRWTFGDGGGSNDRGRKGVGVNGIGHDGGGSNDGGRKGVGVDGIGHDGGGINDGAAEKELVLMVLVIMVVAAMMGSEKELLSMVLCLYNTTRLSLLCI